MPEIILKDKSGTEQTYDYKKISFRTPTEGEKAEFIFPNFAELDITENGEYAVPEGVDGYTKVKANVPVPTLFENMEVPLDFSNGDMFIEVPDGYAVKSAIIKQPANLKPENIAKDIVIAGIAGTHEGGGGGTIEPGIYLQDLGISPPSASKKYNQMLFMFNGKLHCAAGRYPNFCNIEDIYVYENEAWSLVASDVSASNAVYVGASFVEYAGAVHHIYSTGKHFFWDGTSSPIQVYDSILPGTNDVQLFVFNGKLYCSRIYDQTLYVWDEDADTYELVADFSELTKFPHYFVINNEVWVVDYRKKVFKLNGTELEQVATVSYYMYTFQIGTKLYAVRNNTGEVYCFNPATNEEKILGVYPLNLATGSPIFSYPNVIDNSYCRSTLVSGKNVFYTKMVIVE